jgi:protein arginine kinase
MTPSEYKASEDIKFVMMSELDPVERWAMVERHLISPELAEAKKESAVLVNADESVSVMVNEEDHLRIQCIFPGLDLYQCLRVCEAVDNTIDKKMKYAFRQDFGYLTCCPTNVGTGMRASAMMHLPALTKSGYMATLLETCGKIGIAVRGFNGENSDATGNIYQLSNQVSLGQTEEDIIDNVNKIVKQIVESERNAQAEAYAKNRSKVEDIIYRSYGTLLYARIISAAEALKLLSDVRVGVNLGIITDITVKRLNEIMLNIQPATLMRLKGRMLDTLERRTFRSEMIRKLIYTK